MRHRLLLFKEERSVCQQNHGVFACADAEAAQASLTTLQEELASMESSIADAKKACNPLSPKLSSRLAAQAS